MSLGLTACEGNLTDLNRNPNSPETVRTSRCSPDAIPTTVGRFTGSAYSLRGGALLAQHIAEVQYTELDAYARFDQGSTSGYFNGPYLEELADLDKVVPEVLGGRRDGRSRAGHARVDNMSYVTDAFGDVPYFQALAGDSLGRRVSPAYDSQQAIYTDLMSRLSTASTALGTAANALGGADPVYGGDPAMWQKFANSLRARFALLLVNQNPALANTELTAALAASGGIIDADDETAQLTWPGDGLCNNPWSNNFVQRDDHRVSRTLMGVLANTADPRVAVYAQPATRDTVAARRGSRVAVTGGATCYVGLQNGLSQASAGPSFRHLSPGAAMYPGVTVYGNYAAAARELPVVHVHRGGRKPILCRSGRAWHWRHRRRIGAGPDLLRGTASVPPMSQSGRHQHRRAGRLHNGANVSYAAAATQADRLTHIATQKWVALYTDGGTAWTGMAAYLPAGRDRSRNGRDPDHRAAPVHLLQHGVSSTRRNLLTAAVATRARTTPTRACTGIGLLQPRRHTGRRAALGDWLRIAGRNESTGSDPPGLLLSDSLFQDHLDEPTVVARPELDVRLVRLVEPDFLHVPGDEQPECLEPFGPTAVDEDVHRLRIGGGGRARLARAQEGGTQPQHGLVQRAVVRPLKFGFGEHVVAAGGLDRPRSRRLTAARRQGSRRQSERKGPLNAHHAALCDGAHGTATRFPGW